MHVKRTITYQVMLCLIEQITLNDLKKVTTTTFTNFNKHFWSIDELCIIAYDYEFYSLRSIKVEELQRITRYELVVKLNFLKK